MIVQLVFFSKDTIRDQSIDINCVEFAFNKNIIYHFLLN
jgi:hypothetical protein